MHMSLAVKGISLLASVLDARDRRGIAGNPAGNGTGKLALHLKKQAPDGGSRVIENTLRVAIGGL